MRDAEESQKRDLPSQADMRTIGWRETVMETFFLGGAAGGQLDQGHV
jgi:hypothetical protein